MADEETIEVPLDDAPKAEKQADDEIKVEVQDDAPAPKTTRGSKADGAEIAPDEGIERLKRQFEAERRRAAEAELRAAQAEHAAQRAHVHSQGSDYQMVVTAIETVKGRSDMLKSAYSSAMAAGDYDKAAEIQEALAVNAHQLSELTSGEREMRAKLEEVARQPVQPMPRSAEPIAEQLARSVSPRSAEWLRANSDIINNERAVKRMFSAHEDAVEDGLEPDSDEYFAFIESRMNIRRREADTSSREEARAPRRQAPPPPAPVSRGGQRPNVVRLTRAEAEAAKMFGMTEAEYAKNKVALQREGKIGN